MKKLGRFASVMLAVLVAFGLTGCGKDKPENTDPTTPAVTVEDSKKAALEKINALFDALDEGAYSDDDYATFQQLEAYANLFVQNATTVDSIADALATVQAQYDKLNASAKKYASGVHTFVASSYDERAEILGILEAYAYEHFLTGFAFIDDGAYQLYSKTVKRGVDTYVPGYGWATLSDGEIIADLEGEQNPAWKRYYHTIQTEDPGTINYGDDKGSVVGNLIGYVASSYWDTRLTETNDGYEWYSLLAKEKPVAVNAAANGLATKYSWKLKTGADGLKYGTLTNDATLKEFNDRSVEAEDYITPYQMYYTKANGWARSAENLDGAGSIKGSAAYYNASADGFNAEAWEKVGIKVEEVNGEAVMSVEFNVPCTSFYAMYYMSSTIFSPVPKEFVEALGAKNGASEDNAFFEGCKLFGKTSIDKGLTPVDTYLSCGAYTIEAWSKDSEIVFKRNPNFTACGADRFKIAGIHVNILAAAKEDIEATWKEFNAKKLSSCGVPSTQKQDRTRDDAVGYAVYTPGGTTYKLNLNVCTQELWNQLFGEEGTVTTTPVDKYWKCEPAMSNTNFLLGLSWSLDRKTLAESLGRGATVNYFGDDYLSNPENGAIYNETEAHQNAIAAITQNGQYADGYNLEIAKEYFDAACKEFIEKGVYKDGDTIEIEIAWQDTTQFTNYGDPIIGFWQDAFNAVGEEYGLTLKVVNWAGAEWYDVYYSKMMIGQFDIGFGSISGNALNPLNFLEVLKSDNSSGFTLNWGADTSAVNLEYNGMLWSFDALWQAADTGGYFYQGQCVSSHTSDMKMDEATEDYASDCYTENEDGTVTLVISIDTIEEGEDFSYEIEKVCFDGKNASNKYVEWECEYTFDKTTGLLTVTVPKEAVTVLFGADNYYASTVYGHYVMIDVYFNISYDGVPANEVDTVEFAPEWMPAEEN